MVDGYDHLFPTWLHEAPGSPLHALAIFRQWYIREFNDPIVQWSPDKATGHDSWISLFMHIEFLFTLPIVLYTVYRLGIQRKGTSGADELLLLVYGLETALTTSVCLYDVSYWDDALYPSRLKNVFRFQFYGPWMLIRKLTRIWSPGSWILMQP